MRFLFGITLFCLGVFVAVIGGQDPDHGAIFIAIGLGLVVLGFSILLNARPPK